MRRFRKYPNRRLYDIDHARYVTQTDILKVVREGDEVEIVSHLEKRVITAEVLLKALAEYSHKTTGDRVSLLRQYSLGLQS